VFVLLPLAALIAFTGSTDPQAAGLQALDRQDYQQAQKIFSQIAASDPRDYSALFNLALAETGLHQEDAAAEHYKQVLALKPGLYEAELNLGILFIHEQRAGEAVPLLQDAAKQKPTQARAQRYLGESLLATNDLAGAATAFQAALSIDPKQAVAALGMGQTLAREGKLDEAAPYYRQAALDSNLKSYELELAVAFSKANRTDEAIALLKDFPDDAGAREELGRLYLESNRPADAVTEFKAAVELSPTAANNLALATAYLKNNQPAPAKPILERALAASPSDYDLRMAIGRIHRDERDFQAAASQFLAAANIRPDSPEAWSEAASVLVMAEQYPQALAALDKIHALNADKPGDYYYRAMVLDKLHQVKPALASYRQFLAMSQGKFPDQEFIARQRSRILEREANR
jgi:tetratricopeptide (TPR) repeat protein